MAVFSNAFRTDPGKARHITGRACLLGYAVVLVGAPGVGAGLAALTRRALQAAADTVLAPALVPIEEYFRLLALSYLLSWMGALLSIPLVLVARRHGLFGWASAMLAALLVMEAIAWGLMGATVQETLHQLAPPAATLGLLFWGAVRLASPRGFR